MRRCDDCGEAVADTIGTRQCSLFAPADPRIDPHAAEGLRAGRILCPACARGVPLEPIDTPEAVALELELADGEADAADEGPPRTPGEAWDRHPELCEQIVHMGAAQADAADRAFRDSPEFRRTIDAAKRQRRSGYRRKIGKPEDWDREIAGRR